VREAWEVRINGRLVWADRFRLDPPNGDIMDAPAGGGGGRALATVVFAGPEAFTCLDSARATLVAQPGVRAGVTMVNGLLIGRFLGADASKVRLALAGSLAAWRGVLLGQPARLPRLWAI
jgi:urease accessory protein